MKKMSKEQVLKLKEFEVCIDKMSEFFNDDNLIEFVNENFDFQNRPLSILSSLSITISDCRKINEEVEE